MTNLDIPLNGIGIAEENNHNDGHYDEWYDEAGGENDDLSDYLEFLSYLGCMCCSNLEWLLVTLSLDALLPKIFGGFGLSEYCNLPRSPSENWLCGPGKNW